VGLVGRCWFRGAHPPQKTNVSPRWGRAEGPQGGNRDRDEKKKKLKQPAKNKKQNNNKKKLWDGPGKKKKNKKKKQPTAPKGHFGTRGGGGPGWGGLRGVQVQVKQDTVGLIEKRVF